MSERDDARIREIERRNALLDDQVKQLVRTEQRLYLSQRDLARHVARVDALNRFAVEVAGLESPSEIVARAADVLFALFPLDQYVGFVADESGMLTPTTVRAAPGREPGHPPRAQEREPIRLPADPLAAPIVERAGAIRAGRADAALLLERVERIFGGSVARGEDDDALVLMIPIVRVARVTGVLVFRRPSGPISFHEELPTAKDVTFLGVFAQQVGAALTNARLAERERLAAVGELAAVVAHEVRNPLGAIFNSVTMLARLTAGRTDEEHLVRIVREESERLNQIVTDLIEFARPHAQAPRDESIVAITETAIESVRARFLAAAIALRVEEPLPRVRVDGRRLRQALINLLVNAVQASPDGREVEVHVRPAAAQVQVVIVDRGPGVPEAMRTRIFAPFVTTKASGTGLGLAVVKRVADAHGGTIEASPTAGGGATFTLSIAAATDP